MMTIWRKQFVFKFDGVIGTIENVDTKDMYFLNQVQNKLACKSNIELDKIIELIKLGEKLKV